MGRMSNQEFHKEYINLMTFIVEKSKNVQTPLNIKQMIEEFIDFTGSIVPFASLKKRFYQNRMRIHEFDEFDFETKVRILVVTSASVDLGFLKELEKQATVDVDEERRILNYIANDGTLKLKGDHSRSTKGRNKRNEEISSNEYEDYEEENLEDKSNESIMKSGKVSKKRFADSDVSSAKKKVKKNTKSIDSIPTTSSVNNLSSSVNLPPGIQSAEPNDVIYEGPGEPSLPFPLIKREPIQYPMHPEYVENKPMSFVDYNIQLQEEYMKRLIDDDMEFGNTNSNNQHDREVKREIENEEMVSDAPVFESTSSEEFLKFLRNFVKTLCSKLLGDLEKDIQDAMTTMSNENRRVLIKDIEEALRGAISLAIKAAKPKAELSENTTSLLGMLMVFNMFALNNASLTVIQQQIERAIKELGDEDKRISIKNIRIVLKPMLLFVTS